MRAFDTSSENILLSAETRKPVPAATDAAPIFGAAEGEGVEEAGIPGVEDGDVLAVDLGVDTDVLPENIDWRSEAR